MFFDKIPKIFFSDWFWISIAAALIAIHYFFGKPAPPRKPGKFFLEHKKAIHFISDSFLILMLTVFWGMNFYFSTVPVRGWPKDIPQNPDILRFPLELFLMMSISDWGWSAIFIGMLSVFYSNLTRFKRLLLLLISLIPIPLTILLLSIISPHKPEEIFKFVKIGAYSFITCWVFNGPAIITGKHFFRVAWYISRALRLTSGEYPEWW
jgi:hypothetical protein